MLSEDTRFPSSSLQALLLRFGASKELRGMGLPLKPKSKWAESRGLGQPLGHSQTWSSRLPMGLATPPLQDLVEFSDSVYKWMAQPTEATVPGQCIALESTAHLRVLVAEQKLVRHVGGGEQQELLEEAGGAFQAWGHLLLQPAG